MTGTQRIVVRGSVVVFYDRLPGDSIFGLIGNPPTGQGSTVVNSTLQQVAQGTAGVRPPPVMLIYDYDAKIGASPRDRFSTPSTIRCRRRSTAGSATAGRGASTGR